MKTCVMITFSLETGKFVVTVSLTSEELSSLSNTLTSRLLALLQYSLPNMEQRDGLTLSFRGNKRQGVVVFLLKVVSLCVFMQAVQEGAAVSSAPDWSRKLWRVFLQKIIG